MRKSYRRTSFGTLVTLLMTLSLVFLTTPVFANTYTVTNTNDSGAGSLRQAILDANANAGLDNISFNIPGAGPHTIAPLSALPSITSPVVIDGYTQPGASANTLSVGSNAVIKIQLDGVNVFASGLALTSGSDGSTIRGLAIYRFAGGGSFAGIRVDNSTGHFITGNYIGTNATGTAAGLGNYRGLFIQANNNTVGGTTPQARNVISGNANIGLLFDGGNSGLGSLNHVLGNYIGLQPDGASALANVWGVWIANGANSNTIGGTSSASRNVISGNSQVAIVIVDGSSSNVVMGNYIGTDATGVVNRGNGGSGVEIANINISNANNNTIGGTVAGAANRIAYNGFAGVAVYSGTVNNLVSRNEIFSNAVLGIDLNNNGLVNNNDAGDGDSGGNNSQNFPVLTLAATASGSTVVNGTLNSAVNTTFTLEFFSSAVRDGSGFGEGETYRASTTVTTNGSGNANFSVNIPVAITIGHYVSATATDPSNNTSEFAQSVQVTAAPPEMNVTGNAVSIADGDVTPSTADHTDFGSADIATGSVDRVFTIANLGTGDLNLTGTPIVQISGTNAADFSVTIQPTSPVAANGNTTFTVHFDPSAVGLRSATISIANNDANKNPYNFSIQGTGAVAPEMDVLGNSVSIADGDVTPSAANLTDFGSADITTGSVDRVFTIANLGTEDLNLTGTPIVQISGTNAADFSVTIQPTSPVAASGNTTFTVHFDPSATGLRSATISIANDDANENPYNFAIQGTGTVAPEMDVLNNSVSIADGDVTPSAADHTDFGVADISTGSVNRVFTIANLGNVNLNLTGTPIVQISGANAADFSVTVQPASPVAASGNTTFTVHFDPSAVGLRSATISIANDDANENPYDFAIQGTGAGAAEMDVLGNSVSIADGDVTPSATDYTDFGSADISTGTVDRVFTIANLGNVNLNLTGTPKVQISGANAADFSVTVQPASPVAASGNTTFTVHFDPSAVGLRSATISIANDDANENPYDFAIQGTGTGAAEMDVLGNSVSIADGDVTPSATDYTDFGSADISTGSVDRVFTIANLGNVNLNLTGSPKVQISGVNAADFSVTVQPVSPVAASGNTTFTVHFDPSATGLRSATISIANDDADENPYDFAIQGTGTGAAEMDVLGNSVSIADGDVTPSTADHTDFGSADISTGSVDRVFTIANLGNVNLNLTGTPKVQISGANAADFSVTVQPSSPVAASGSTTFTVHFDPSATGLRSATISIANDDANENPYDFAIQGTGTGAAEMDVLGNSVSIADGDVTPSAADHTDFGSADISTGSVDRVFTIANLGNVNLNLTSSPKVQISGADAADFSVTVQPASPVAASGNTTFTVHFDPSATGLRSATISIANDDANENPYDFAIQGTGDAPPPIGKAFVFLANTVTLKQDKQSAPAGDIHSNGSLTIEKGSPSKYNSNLTAVGNIVIQKDNTINGNVRSAKSISNSGTIKGTKTIGAVNTEPLPSLSYSAGGSSYTIAQNGTLALAPGSYNNVTLNSWSKLKLTSGTYYFNQLKYSGTSTTTAVVEIALNGNPITVNVVSDLYLGNEVEIRLPNGEADSKLVTFNTLQTSQVTLGREAYLLGSYNAPNALVKLEKNSQLRGAICAQQLIVERDCLFLHHDSPGSLPGPGNLPKAFDEDEEAGSDQSTVITYQLAQNYPNPFNPTTTISFVLPEAGKVSLTVFNMNGQLVKQLVAGEMGAGHHSFTWDATNEHGERVASGVYLYVLNAGEFTARKKLMLMK